MTPLPKQNIDTGLGLERGAAILQDVRSVYETDGYQQIMDWIAAESGVAYGDSPAATKAHRILADHGRGMTFLVGDGVTPSNEGRGYVLRRIIRRAVQQAQRIGLHDVHRLSAVVVEQMGDAYPELPPQADEIARVLRLEEERFGETLERGLKLFEELGSESAIAGEQAFTLAATYGFPVELTVELAEERGQAVDLDGYRVEMERHREVSRATSGSGELQRAADFARGADFTTEFVGYAKTDVLTQIGALEELEDGHFLAKLRESPFYRGGRRAGDAMPGRSSSTTTRARRPSSSTRIGSRRTRRCCSEDTGSRPAIACGRACRRRCASRRWRTTRARTSSTRRSATSSASTCARPARRFGRTSSASTSPTTSALTVDERDAVERRVNEIVFENRPVHVFETPIDEARKLGATMLFGEKYGDIVRVVEVPGYSVELCGGTHVASSAEIGPVRAPVGELGRRRRPAGRGGDLGRGVGAARRACARAGRRCAPRSTTLRKAPKAAAPRPRGPRCPSPRSVPKAA